MPKRKRINYPAGLGLLLLGVGISGIIHDYSLIISISGIVLFLFGVLGASFFNLDKWVCEHCGKKFDGELSCLEHEKSCRNKN